MTLSPTRRGTASIERMPSLASSAGSRERGSPWTSSTRSGVPVSATRPMMPAPRGVDSVRHSPVRKPWAAACSTVLPSAVSRPMPHPTLPMSAFTDRLMVVEHGGQVQARADEPARLVQGGEGLGAAHGLRVEARALDRPGDGARHLREDLDVLVAEGARAVVAHEEHADHAPLGHERRKHAGVKARGPGTAHGSPGAGASRTDRRSGARRAARPPIAPPTPRWASGSRVLAAARIVRADDDVHEPELPALGIEEGDAEELEGDERRQRARHRLIDPAAGPAWSRRARSPR